MLQRLAAIIATILTISPIFPETKPIIDSQYVPETDLLQTRTVKIDNKTVAREFYEYNNNLLFRKTIDNGTVEERLITDYSYEEKSPFSTMPKGIKISYSNGTDSFLIREDKIIYDFEGNIRLQNVFQVNYPISFQFIQNASLMNLHRKDCIYDPSFQRWIDPKTKVPLDQANLFFEREISCNIGSYLLGLGEIVLGGALMITGGIVELGSFGVLTVGFVVAEGTGAALIGHGLTLTTTHAQEIRQPYYVSKNDPGTPKRNDVQNTQFDDAVKEIERRTGKKLSEKDRRKLHDQISGQNYGYHDIVEEGVWVFHD